MARSPSKSPVSDPTGSALDRAIEASLRRQFVVPAPLANAGAPVAVTGWEWPSLNFQISLPRVTLRAAAGILLAASLWGGAGLIVFSQVGGSRPRNASASGPAAGEALNPDVALARLAVEFARPGSQRVVEQEAFAEREARLWGLLESELEARYGESLENRVAELRKSGQMELLEVSESFGGNDSLLMVSARVEGTMTVALIEKSEDRVSRLRLPSDRRADAGEVAPAGLSPEAQLFRGRVTNAIGYEITAAGQPLLVPLLFEGTPMRSLMRLRPERYRGPQNISAAIVPPG